MWWYTFPRLVLNPSEVKISKSMKQVIKSAKFTVTMNTAFAKVIDACSTVKRKDQEGTWLNSELKEAFCALHHLDMLIL